MANMCDVQIIARGFKSKENMQSLADFFRPQSLEQELLPLFDSYVELFPENNKLTVSGWSKWTALSLMDVCLGKQKEEGVVSLEDLAKRYGIVFEVLGKESGCNVGEHYVIDEEGKTILEEFFNYYEFFTDDFDSYDDFIEKIGEEHPDAVESVSKEEFESTDFLPIGEPDTPFGAYIDDMLFPAL